MRWCLGKSFSTGTLHTGSCSSTLSKRSRLDTGTIGPVTVMPSFIETFGTFSATVHGVIVSSILVTGTLVSLVGGILADRYGRPRMIALGSLIFGIGAAIETTSVKLPMFIIGRLIKGVGEGIFLINLYVLVAEISPAKRRGTVTNITQLMISFGVVLGYFICYGTQGIHGSLSWRLPLAIQAAIALTNAAACSLVPQSPRWLLMKGSTEQARQTMVQLGIPTEEQEELFRQEVAGPEHSPNMSFFDGVKETLRGSRDAFAAPVRGRTTFGCFILAMLQFSGIDGVLYYAPIIFKQAGLGSTQATFFASGISALVMMIITVPATLMCDMWGRRTSSLVGGSLMFFFMLLIGSLYAAGRVYADHGVARWVVIVSVYLWACVWSTTWALGFRMYMIESLPRKTRSSGASLAQGSNWVRLSKRLVDACEREKSRMLIEASLQIISLLSPRQSSSRRRLLEPTTFSPS